MIWGGGKHQADSERITGQPGQSQERGTAAVGEVPVGEHDLGRDLITHGAPFDGRGRRGNQPTVGSKVPTAWRLG